MKMKRNIKQVYAPPTGGPAGRAGALKMTGVHMDTQSRPPCPEGQLPAGPAPASFESWSIQRLSEENGCVMEETYSCVPLSDDPICSACWRTLTEEAL